MSSRDDCLQDLSYYPIHVKTHGLAMFMCRRISTTTCKCHPTGQAIFERVRMSSLSVANVQTVAYISTEVAYVLRN